MKLYLACSWDKKAEVKLIADELRSLGYEITSTWTEEPDGPRDTFGDYTPEYLAEIAKRNINELDACDTLILFALNPKVPHYGGGRHFEFGYACATGKSLILVGPCEHVFHNLPCVIRVDNTHHLYQLLLTVRFDQVMNGAA